ncbi:COG2378 Predicted transcriptional regulator [Candidatus Nanopelagicaceae bacterium]
MSRKSERLVNLTIALLATKRYLTKAEIFKTVAGYDGDTEAKDRMFERDKDDLRSLGITIELGTFDPLFEDEAGYRIKPENYALQLENLDTTDLALLSQASKLWREAALGSAAQTGLRKLKALGIDSDIDSFVDLNPQVHATPEQLPDLIEAITEKTKINFEYLDEELKTKLRQVEPYRLSNARGFWYLIGNDLDRGALRTFRLDRIASAISLKGNSNAFNVDPRLLDEIEASYLDSTKVASVAIRKGTSVNLRSTGVITEIDDEWDAVEIQYQSEDELLQEVFWQAENAYILSPESLRELAIERLEKVLAQHG